MIQARSIYRHRYTPTYVLTDHQCGLIVLCRTLTRDLNCPSGFCLEQHHLLLRFHVRPFERDWEFIKPL